jgi:hypothetical protein
MSNSNNAINTTSQQDICVGNDCDCSYNNDGFDSDSEEYQKFITNIDNKFMNFKNMYKGFCETQGKEVNPIEMFAFMDILHGGSGKMIFVKDIAERDRKYIQPMEDLQEN